MSTLRPLLTVLAAAALVAAEGVPPVAPPPAPAPGPMQRPQLSMPARSAIGAEVDLLVLANAADPAGLALWAERAIQGYRLNQVVATPDGKVLLFLDRTYMASAANGPIRLPAVLEADAAQADALRARLQAELQARQVRPAMAPGGPVQAAPMPAPVALPAAPPAAVSPTAK